MKFNRAKMALLQEGRGLMWERLSAAINDAQGKRLLLGLTPPPFNYRHYHCREDSYKKLELIFVTIMAMRFFPIV